MDSNYITYGLLAIVVFLYLRKFLAGRNLVHYTAAEVKELLQNKKIILLDVRTEGERKGRHIKESIHIPLVMLSSRLNDLEKYKEKEIVCYCASGSRSVSAASMLKKKGFNAANMRGGISAWS